MNSQTLISIYSNPEILEGVSLSSLEELMDVYPFFTLGQLALTKKMQFSQHLMVKKAIKKTAVITPDRKIVYEFLYQKNIQKSIINSNEDQSIEAEQIHSEKSIEVTESEETGVEIIESSFSAPIEIPKRKEVRSEFKKPFDLKELSASATKEMDQLEKQIIGQTIEHVLASEIANNYPETEPKPQENKQLKNTTGKQKFSEWLEILDQTRLKSFRESDSIEPNEPSEADIIDSFLQKDVNIISPTQNTVDFSPSNLARLSVVDDEDFVTETLANIYNRQGNHQKAINAFNKLILKYPEKKTYFAARIKKIEQDLK